ncbi:MAG: phosphatidate cytidylyltransferase [Planctomycetota bacterium]
MLRDRLLFGPIMVLAVLAGTWFDGVLDATPLPGNATRTFPPAIIVGALTLILAALASRELVDIFRAKGIQASIWLTTALAWMGVLLAGTLPDGGSAFVGAATVSTATVVVVVATLVYSAREKQVEGIVTAAGAGLLAFVYIGLLLGFLIAICREHAAWTAAWVALVTKMTDVGAYFVGRAIGKHKLAPWLSPGKTWEGLAGGVVFGVIVGAAGTLVPTVSIHPVAGAIYGALFAFVGLGGDLIASLLKRDAGRKDASDALPGFGGIIDVLDSLLLVLPLAYWLLHFGPAA